MKKSYLLAAFLGAAVAIFDLGVVNLLWGNHYFTALIPLAFFLTLLVPLETALIFAACAGLIFDFSSLGTGLLMTAFLIFQVALIHFLKKKLVNFSGFLSVCATVFFLMAFRAAIIFAPAGMPAAILAARVFVALALFSLLLTLLYFACVRHWRHEVRL